MSHLSTLPDAYISVIEDFKFDLEGEVEGVEVLLLVFEEETIFEEMESDG